MKKTKRRILPRADINVTPFIDILLVLLVIFMTISPTTPAGIKTNIPQEPPPGPRKQEPPSVVVLSMDRNGVIKINQTDIEPAQLPGRLRDIFKTRSEGRSSCRPIMNCCSMTSPNSSMSRRGRG